MRHWKAFIPLFFLTAGLYGQESTVNSTDSLLPVTVIDYEISADNSMKEQIVNADSLSKSGRLSLAQLLQNNTGIFVKTYGGNGVASLSFRGTNASQTNVFWNNLEIGSPMLGQADFSIIPVQAFDQANIQYGFASLSGGSGALGGSIRLTNKVPPQNEESFSISQVIGSFGRYQTSARFNFGNTKFRSQTSAYIYTADNNYAYPDVTEANYPEKVLSNSRYQQQGIIQNFFYRLKAKQLISIKTWFNHVDRQLPPPITGDQITYNELEDYSLAAIAEYQKQGTRHSLLINSGIVRADNIYTRIIDDDINNNRFMSWQNNFRHKLKIGSKIKVENGLTYKYETAASGDYISDGHRHHSGIFTQWNYEINSSLGMRVLLREELINDYLSPLIGSLGLVYQMKSGSKFRLNAAHNFRYPTLNDIYWDPGGNSGLHPETSWNFEAGYNFLVTFEKGSRHKLDFGATAFYNLVDNWIQWIPIADYTTPVNLKNVVNTGVEIESNGSFMFNSIIITERISYSYTNSSSTQSYSGIEEVNNQLPYVPFHNISGGIGLRYRTWEIRYTQNFTSRYFTTSDNDVYMPAYSIAEISLLGDNLLNGTKHQLSGAFTVSNLFDVPYQVLPYRPEPGINFSIQLTYSFGS